jgi:outer membrane protein assembly factor BamE (lipoprotein component of BamABCDE complex)
MPTRPPMAGCSLLVLAFFALTACRESANKFDSQKWKVGSFSSRGEMAQDLIERKVLEGKSKTEVENLIGKPDEQGSDIYHYQVITLSRCYFWKCGLQVVFDQTAQVKSVNVSD